MVNCAAIGCSNSSKTKKADDVKGWHVVPYKQSEADLRKKWLQAMKRDPGYPENPKNFVLCGLHFEDDCFARDRKFELMGGKRTYLLLKDSVPSVFSFSKSVKKRTSSESRAEERARKS